MSNQNIIFYDFETCSANPNRTQPIQLAAIAIDGKKNKIIDNSEFNSYIKPYFDKKTCDKYNLDMVMEEALQVNKIPLEKIEDAPSPREVWEQFKQYVLKYHTKKGKWGAPIKAGYNNSSFDDVIINRLCGGNNRSHPRISKKLIKDSKNDIESLENEKSSVNKLLDKLDDCIFVEPYKFGPWDDDREEETMFFPRGNIDVMKSFVWTWTENMDDMRSISMDSVREWLDISKEGAHDALKDVRDGATVLTKFINLQRHFAPKVKWKGKN